jgi:tripartite-type tricarboxylate transporter receptor subunit TctC
MVFNHHIIALVTSATLALSPFATQAQDYPNKPIRIIAPFPAGSGPDVNTREIAAELSKVLGQSVVVENKPGAATMIGMEAGAKATPDGYTLVMGSTTSLSVVPHAYSKVPYKISDFAPISLLGFLNTALIANSGVPQSNAKELITELRSKPESVIAGTSGVGSYSHISGVWFTFASDTKMQFIPYNTSSVYGDLVAGQVKLMFDALPAAIGNVKAGKLKILALTGTSRHPNFPDVPTFSEAGLNDYSPTAWTGLFAPIGTPKVILDKLGAAMQKATTQNPELIARWRSYGGELKAMTPDEFSNFIKNDSAKWEVAIRKAGIKLD